MYMYIYIYIVCVCVCVHPHTHCMTLDPNVVNVVLGSAHAPEPVPVVYKIG